MLGIQTRLGEDRWSSIAAIVIAGLVGAVTFLSVLRLLGGPRWVTVLRRGVDAV